MGIGQDLGNMAKEKVKNAATQAAKKVKKAILNAIKAALPYIAMGIGIMFIVLIIVCIFADFNDLGQTASAAGIEGTGWWWPIGSLETTKVNGKLFASGEPALGKNDISRMGEDGKAYGISINNHPGNLAIDIAAHGETNKYNVISIGNGTVTLVRDGIPEGQNPNANGGRGNHIVVDYGEITVYYVHLYAGSIQVKEGDTVEYGQVIGRIGHNGDSTGPHLHFEVKVDGKSVDATEYVDPDNPRPTREIEYNNVDTSLIQYLLNFGGDGTTYEIDEKEFYLSYDDSAGNLTVGLDVYIEGHQVGFSVPRMGFRYS